MLHPTAATLLSGAVFGSGLTLSGVASPRIMKDQFALHDFHMLATFLTASAASTLIIATHNYATTDPKKNISARPPKALGWLGSFKYDGNIIGGAMIGLGMSMTGACPGTVLVQAVAGSGKGRVLAASAFLAGAVWARWGPSVVTAPQIQAEDSPPATVMTTTGWSVSGVILWYELAIAAALASILALKLHGHSAAMHPVASGMLIGSGQLASVTLSRSSVGVSSVYPDCGSMLWNLYRTEKGQEKRTLLALPNSLVFACGLMAGSWLALRMFPAARIAMTATAMAGTEPSLLTTVVGGFVLVFGARLAGGCTSGHGISGMATMGLSSFVTVFSMFGTALLSTYFMSW
ncbi:uncharacterized protein B0I36DRAFT_339524 [Microdochium trichocladiopsis]|uniref:Sulphur transport domain-containing protein n=1 Tax=Microdochium trichocladiopsis TaxID=1682393 RepID=A0A9P9BIQ1_9PEZI|nr:uncharacterized protein B0I36DRAFT_339524 [Microdochium trichocladiopsis]KAH7012518.1 hypothetical protein B0I36DRAFT_339524 [Microdochium trichocladiopsis]